MSKLMFYLCLTLALTMATLNGYFGNSQYIQILRLKNIPFFVENGRS